MCNNKHNKQASLSSVPGKRVDRPAQEAVTAGDRAVVIGGEPLVLGVQLPQTGMHFRLIGVVGDGQPLLMQGGDGLPCIRSG